MDITQKRKLEERGWKIGSASDFLNLSKEERTYIDLKIAFGNHVKIKRISKKITQVELAKKINSSQSRIAKMEIGDPSVSIDLQIKTLLILGATPKDLEKVFTVKSSIASNS